MDVCYILGLCLYCQNFSKEEQHIDFNGKKKLEKMGYLC